MITAQIFKKRELGSQQRPDAFGSIERIIGDAQKFCDVESIDGSGVGHCANSVSLASGCKTDRSLFTVVTVGTSVPCFHRLKVLWAMPASRQTSPMVRPALTANTSISVGVGIVNIAPIIRMIFFTSTSKLVIDLYLYVDMLRFVGTPHAGLTPTGAAPYSPPLGAAPNRDRREK